MGILSRFLLPAVAIVPLTLTTPAIAQEGSAKPAKSAQDCADELLRNKEAIEAAGETPQEFFHRCWWDSAPGKPTPIKTPRATWDPGRGHPSRSPLAKPPIEAKRPTEPQKISRAKPGEAKSAEGKRLSAAKEASDVKSPVPPKAPAKPNRSAEQGKTVEKPVEKATAPKPPAKPASSDETKPAKEPAGSKSMGPAAETKKKEPATAKAPVQAPKSTSVVTAPNAAPASVKAAASGEVVVSSPKKSKSGRVAAANAHHRTSARSLAGSPPIQSAWRPSRNVATHRAARAFKYAYRPPFVFADHPPRPRMMVGRGFGRQGWVARAPILCVYAAPDASGQSACVPISTP